MGSWCFMSNYKKFTKLSYSKYCFILYLVTGLLYLCFALMHIYYLGLLINDLVIGNFNNFIMKIIIGGCLEILVLLTRQWYIFAKNYMLKVNLSSIRNTLLTSILAQDISTFNQHNYGYYTATLYKDCQAIEEKGLVAKQDIIFHVFRLAFILFIILRINNLFLLLVVIIAVINLLLPYLLKRIMLKLAHKKTLINEQYASRYRNYLFGLSTLAFSNKFDFGINLLIDINNDYERKFYSIQQKEIGINGFIEVFRSASNSLLIFSCLYLGFSNVIALGLVIPLLKYNSFVNDSLNIIVEKTNNLNMIEQYITKLDLNFSSSFKLNYNNGFENITKLSLKNIDFYYNQQHQILKNINIDFLIGKKYALIGENGSGKSTLAKLLSGLIVPTDGLITINDFSTNSLFEFVVYINQHPFIFKDTLSNNINFENGNIDQKLLKKYNLDLDETIFKQRKSDIISNNSVSGGQAQLIEIARAISANKKFLIFDESFNSIDTKSRELILDVLLHSQNLCLIFITHRLNDFSLFDYVYELKDGSLSCLK